jgi:hypothetical protein
VGRYDVADREPGLLPGSFVLKIVEILFAGGLTWAGGVMLNSGHSRRGGGREEGEMNITTKIKLHEWSQEISGVKMDSKTLMNQIGMMNVLSVSGGRALRFGESVIFPVAHGYHVCVSLEADDTYTVRRVYVRNGVTIKKEISYVFADNIGEVVYRASLND